ncbi:MAG TPA: hypothetical protein VI112_04400 [Bacteroidia bacterium]
MTRYKNLSGTSGVRKYSISADHIDVQFSDGETYRYSHRAPGRTHVEKMKELAEAGSGLATYINKYVRDNYERKF